MNFYRQRDCGINTAPMVSNVIEDNPYSRKNQIPMSEKKLVKTTTWDKSDDPEWLQIKKRRGSLERPIAKNRMDEEDIFLGKNPQINDIIQGVINDCYFLAAVTSIVNKAPFHLRKMMTSSGGTHCGSR